MSVCVFVCIPGKRHSLQRKPLRCERAPHFLNRRNHREKKTLEEEKEQLSSRTTAWFAGQGESAITILFRLQSSGFLVAEYGFYV